eukprot:TRINITY_DN8965_c0_g1_i2.p1 TRINITY_DN8965_c0_g1~~TRINITY_DN8965_c0_g1_i2.p1  ORF type:complete len:371 (+),score=83.70 TRINITY_DN8965_c0_g1_i2:76-1113(+)
MSAPAPKRRRREAGPHTHRAARTAEEEEEMLAEAIRLSAAAAGVPPPAAGSFRDRLTPQCRIGAGAQGSLFMCKTPDGSRVVLKEIPCADEAQQCRIESWATTIWHDVSHAHIIRYLDVSRSPVEGTASLRRDEKPGKVICVGMPYYEGGDLDRLIQKRGKGQYFTVEFVLTCALQIASALRYLHSMAPGVVHMDIKPANVLLESEDTDRCVAVLTDLESAVAVGARSADEGTQPYMAPEAAASGKCTPACDVWSFGVLLLCMCTLPDFPMLYCSAAREEVLLNSSDWTPRSLSEAIRKSIAGTRCAWPGRLTALLISMLAHNPQGRPTSAEVASELSAILQSVR